MAFRRLQDRPRILEIAYVATLAALRLFRNRLNPGGLVEKVFVPGERVTKGLIFDCKMCGDCVLHNTGMTCPMTCPKNLRNGPCGGVRLNGNCEIIPEMRCVWVDRLGNDLRRCRSLAAGFMRSSPQRTGGSRAPRRGSTTSAQTSPSDRLGGLNEVGLPTRTSPAGRTLRGNG